MNSLSNFVRIKKNEIIKNLVNLIRAKTINPPGNTGDGISIISEILDKYGVKYKIVEPVKGKQSIIAEIGDESNGSIILNGHIDVVPAGTDWKINPFEGKIIDNKLYGRGSSDMKSGVIAILYSFLAYLDNPPGKITLTIVADEETGGKHGSEYIVNNGYIKGDACLVAEPTGNLKTGQYSIAGGEKGILWLKVITRGISGHGSLPMIGKNAIREMIKFISNLPELIPSKKNIPSDALELIKDGKIWLKRIREDLDKTIDSFTINVGVIKGGEKANIIPDKCEAQVDIRIPIGSTVNDALDLVKELSGIVDNFDIIILNKTEPSYTPLNSRLSQVIMNTAQRFLGYKPLYTCMSATSDARFFRFNNIPTINFGPGYLEVAHSANEFVYLRDVLMFIDIYINFIGEYFLPT